MSKILYISYNDALGHLGYSQIIPYLKDLKKFGYEFTLLSYERNRVSQKQREYMQGLEIDWKFLKYHQTPSLLATTFDILLGIFYTNFVILKQRIKIIHARSYVPALIGLLAGKPFGVKLIFDMRGFLAEEYAEGGGWHPDSFKFKLVKFFEKILLKYSDEVITLTYEAKKILLENYKIVKEITVIPCCVDSEKFLNIDETKSAEIKERHALSNKTVIVYSGSLGSWYMIEEMVDFFNEAKKQIDNLHFLILTNSNEKIVKEVFNEKEVGTENYTILRLDPIDMPIYLSIADFSIAFIKPCFSKKASSPIKFAEYLTVGLPLVTNSGIGDSDKMITENVGYVTKDFKLDEYKRAITNIMKLLRKRDETKRACYEVVEKYMTLESGVASYYKVYKRLNGI